MAEPHRRRSLCSASCPCRVGRLGLRTKRCFEHPVLAAYDVGVPRFARVEETRGGGEKEKGSGGVEETSSGGVEERKNKSTSDTLEDDHRSPSPLLPHSSSLLLLHSSTPLLPFSSTSYWFVVLLFALGLMAKPMLVTLPFVLLLCDFWPLARLKTLKDLWPRIFEKLPLFALSAAPRLSSHF